MPECGFGSVAVMHVEVENGDAFRAMLSAGMQRGDSGAVVNAKAHSPFRFCVMTRRAGGDERILCFALIKRIDRCNGAAGGAGRRFQRRRAHKRIRIELREALCRRILFNSLSESVTVHALDRIRRNKRRRAAIKRGKFFRTQRFIHRFVTAGMLHMAGRRLVALKDRMGIK